MIFITVGTQAPFDRLIKYIDEWARRNKRDCFAQIGNSDFIPSFLKYKKFLNQEEFNFFFSKAEFIISHAGMGTIIQCASKNKPILTLPRRLQFHEHRNDHQIATTTAMAKMGFIHPIFTEDDLENHLKNYSELKGLKKIGERASSGLQNFLEEILK